jgi:ATP phosphoribosyltransferase regulatory subunit
LRVKGTQLRPERQFGQIGAELIGAESVAADVEVILMGIEAMAEIGVTGLSVDIGIPTLVPALLNERTIKPETLPRLRQALDRKDAAAIASLGDSLGSSLTKILGAFLAAAGPAERALAALSNLDLPAAAAAQRALLVEAVGGVSRGLSQSGHGTVQLTLDPVENRGFEYHTGVTFTFFAAAVRGELGSGGRYRAGGNGAGEPSTGITFFTDTLLAASPQPAAVRRVYLPASTSAPERRRLRDEGWVTISALAPDADPAAQARIMGCNYIWRDGQVAPLDKT